MLVKKKRLFLKEEYVVALLLHIRIVNSRGVYTIIAMGVRRYYYNVANINEFERE